MGLEDAKYLGATIVPNARLPPSTFFPRCAILNTLTQVILNNDLSVHNSSVISELRVNVYESQLANHGSSCFPHILCTASDIHWLNSLAGEACLLVDSYGDLGDGKAIAEVVDLIQVLTYACA